MLQKVQLSLEQDAVYLGEDLLIQALILNET